MSLVTLRDVSVAYGATPVLEGVNLDIYPDDFLGVIGPNGGGKTTLVKAILGAVPYKGTIHYDKELGGLSRIGYLPQQNDFDRAFPISIREVVLSGLQSQRLFHRYTRTERNRAEVLLEMVGIASVASRSVAAVSGGQLQRALLCRALISEPRLLILDEPANFVDNRFEKELYEILHRLNEHIAILMVSHDLGTITSVVKNIVCVNRSVHRHPSNRITPEQLRNYDCPLQIVRHGDIPHTVLETHP